MRKEERKVLQLIPAIDRKVTRRITNDGGSCTVRKAADYFDPFHLLAKPKYIVHQVFKLEP